MTESDPRAAGAPRAEPDAHGTEPEGAGGLFERVLPKTALGLASLLFFMSVASAFTGAVLFSYYRFELDDTRERLADVESSIADDVEAARQIVEQETDSAIAEIEQILGELEQLAGSGQTVDELLAGVGESVYFVSTLDENGAPSVGTAFVLFSDSERSYLLTSYTTIRAATVSPGPGIEVRRDGQVLGTTLNGWDEQRDLALLLAEEAPNLPAVTLADPASVRAGDRIFGVTGLGNGRGAAVRGQVVDVASNAIQHDAQIGTHFQGGPMFNADGELVAIASRSYAPFGFAADSVFFGIPIREACAQVVSCPTDLTG